MGRKIAINNSLFQLVAYGNVSLFLTLLSSESFSGKGSVLGQERVKQKSKEKPPLATKNKLKNKKKKKELFIVILRTKQMIVS